MEVWVTVLRGKLEHYGSRVRGDRFKCSRHIAEKLAARGAVRIEGDAEPENPTAAGGEKSSASPAGQVSPEQTASSSGPGETPAEGNSETPPESEHPPESTLEASPTSNKGGKRRARGKAVRATDAVGTKGDPAA